MAPSMVCNSFSLPIGLSSKYKTRSFQVLARGASAGPDPSVPPIKITNSLTQPGTLVGKSSLLSNVDKNRTIKQTPDKLEPLWDDGFGKVSVKDYIDASKDIIGRGSGPPRWFCPVECGQPLKDSPVLLFLPGIDGTGMGLILHHKPLGRMFQVRCLHIPVYDRTPFEELVDFVEETVRLEHASSPAKPIYLVGDSLGGCLALAVAARNPTIDLVLILSNPATSFHRSHVHVPTIEAFPSDLYFTLPYLMSLTISEPLKLTMAAIDGESPLRVKLQQQCENLISIVCRLPDLVDIIPRETMLWRLKLAASAASYANSRLHNVEAEVLVLASGKDKMLPSVDEAHRLKKLIKKCDVRIFNNNGHLLLQEGGISLARVIKGSSTYRRSSHRHDFVSDFLPPSVQEMKVFSKHMWFLQNAVHPMALSTLEDGKIARGLAGVPSEGPVLLVGNHLSIGIELFSLVSEFLMEKNIMLRGMAHKAIFTEKLKDSTSDIYFTDWMRVLGAIPVTSDNLMKLMAAKSHALLYPGGTREGLHFRGETHKLFWPEKPEFVRIAAKFGAKIVPFGVVGEDDLAKLVLDYKDLMKIPMVNDYARHWSHDLKIESFGPSGAHMEQELFPPVLIPNPMSGRLYFLFGKPIDMRAKQGILQDREAANELYMQIRSQVQHNVSYLLRKREEDPYRYAIERLLYRMSRHPAEQVPTFEL